MKPFISKNTILNIAHRGGAGERPESTLEAFRYALAVGADVLELDVHLSRDGELVVSHDEELRRISGKSGRIAELTVEELKGFDAGALWTPDGSSHPFRARGLTLPTLSELFEELPDAQMNIDLKVEGREAAEKLTKLIRRFDRVRRTVVASFFASSLTHVRRSAPEIATSGHPGDIRRFLLLSHGLLGFLASDRIPYLQVPERHGRVRVVTKRLLTGAHRAGREVHVWTVNEIDAMRRLIELGVDGLVTDYPSRLTALLGEMYGGPGS